MFRTAWCLVLLPAAAALAADQEPKAPAATLPKPGDEVILSAVVQHPRGKPCIDEYGERIQAFVGCSKADGGDAKMAGYFVFLVDVPTEDVHAAMTKLGCKPRVHYSMAEGR